MRPLSGPRTGTFRRRFGQLCRCHDSVGEISRTGRIVTADALLTQRKPCEQIVVGEGHHVLPVDACQPPLLVEAEELFSHWLAAARDGDGVPISPRWLTNQGGQINGVLRWLGGTGTHQSPWPHVHLRFRLERHRIPIRDVTFDDHRSAVCFDAATQVMAASRCLVLALLCRQHHHNIAAVLRTYASRPCTAVQLVVNTHLRKMKWPDR